MERKIKFRGYSMSPTEFRGYDPDTERWYYGSYARLERTTPYPMSQTPEADAAKFEAEQVDHYIFFTEPTDWGLPTRKLKATVDPKSVGRFTGLFDKKVKRIYEGDLFDDCTVALLWCDTCKSFALFSYIDGKEYCYQCAGDISWSDVVTDGALEVVGNIYETPEWGE